MREVTLWTALAVVAGGLLAALTVARRARRHLGTTSQRAAYEASGFVVRRMIERAGVKTTRIVASGGPELASRVETEGYEAWR